jgi:Co/Zn/Cd efflux system component
MEHSDGHSEATEQDRRRFSIDRRLLRKLRIAAAFLIEYLKRMIQILTYIFTFSLVLLKFYKTSL